MLWQSTRRFFLRHPAQCLLALTGMSAGVAVMTGALLLQAVLGETLEDAGRALAGDDNLRLRAIAGPMDERDYARLARRDGAPDLVPLIRARVWAGGQPLQLLGVDALAGLPLLPAAMASELAISADAIVLPAATAGQLGASGGDRLVLTHQGRALEVEVAAVAPLPRGFDGHVLMDIAGAQGLLNRPGVLDELLAPGRAEDWLVRHLPPDWIMQPAAWRIDSARQLTRGLRVNVVAMSLLALAVGLFVVFAVMSFLFVQRKRDFGVLRALGTRPAQLAGLLLREAVLLGAIGALLGIVLGTWLADWLLALVREPIMEIYHGVPALSVRGGSGFYAGIVAAGLAAALAATAPVIAEAARVPPLHWLRALPASNRRWRWPAITVLAVSGVLCIALSQTLVPAQFGLFLLLAAYAAAMPMAGMVVLQAAARLAPMRAATLPTTGARRVGPALAALGLAISVAAGLAMMVAGFRAGVDDWIAQLLRADAYLTLQQTALDDAAVRQVRALPVIAAVSSARRVVLADGRELVAYDLPDPAWAGFKWLDHRPGFAEDFRAGRAVLITEPFARRHGLEVGDEIALPAPAGAWPLEIAGIFRDYSSERGFIALAGEAYRARWGDEIRDNLGLYFTPETEPESARGAVVAALAARAPRLTLPADIRAQTLAVFDRTFRVTTAMRALVGLIALVALISSLLALALERGRDFATLRALGMTPARLGALVVAQTAVLALAAAVLAVPAALLVHGVLSGVIQPRAFGWTVPMIWPVGALAGIFPWVLLAGCAAGLYPAWKIARQPPAQALRGL